MMGNYHISAIFLCISIDILLFIFVCGSALRVTPTVTRLTVYRRLKIKLKAGGRRFLKGEPQTAFRAEISTFNPEGNEK